MLGLLAAGLLVTGGTIAHAAEDADGPAGYPEYFGTIGDSAVDSYSFHGDPWTGEKDLYVWVHCYMDDPLSGVVLEIEATDLSVVSFTPMNGFQQNGTLPILDLSSPDCVNVPRIVGTLRVIDPTGDGGAICVNDPGPAVGCHTSFDFTMGMTGFSSLDVSPCVEWWCPVDVVVPESWAKVRAKYR